MPPPLWGRRWHLARIARFCVGLVILLSPGCIPPPVDDVVSSNQKDPNSEFGTAPAVDDSVYDIGPIVARDQILRHDFTLTNYSDKPLRILGGMSDAPCCSGVESLPDSIPPGAGARVSVFLKPGNQTGQKVVRFAIETDSREKPVHTLTFRASLFGEWEVVPLAGPIPLVPVGSRGKQSLRLVCRREGDEGLRLPQTVEVREPLRALPRQPGNERVLLDGLIESSLDVEVEFPGASELGLQQAEISFHWPGGRTRTAVIRWEVTPLVRISPSSIVIEPTGRPVERSITITSDDRSVRITSVSGAILAKPAEFPSLTGRTHQLTVWLEPSRAVPGAVSRVSIGIDHPNQLELALSVLALPSRKPR